MRGDCSYLGVHFKAYRLFLGVHLLDVPGALLFVGGFAAMVGIEEWLHVALVEERAALLAFPVFGLSILGTVAFTVRCACLRSRQDTA